MIINIAQEQKKFLQALDRSLSASTKQKYSKDLSRFLEWLNAEELKLHQINYTDVLAFVRYIKKQGFMVDTVNKIIHVVRQYCMLKVREGILKRNPVIGVKVRGMVKRVPHDLLDRITLDKLYERYPNYSIHDKRNRVILGLLVFQGLTSGDLKRLDVQHVKLNEGKIHIPGSPAYVHRGGINGRVLELRSNQLIELQAYLIDVRPQLTLARTGKLFVSDRGGKNIQQAISWLSVKLRKSTKNYRNVDQLRASVIADWLKEKDVRIVQYMAGHKKVKSTEHYKAVRLEDLQHILDQYHPMK